MRGEAYEEPTAAEGVDVLISWGRHCEVIFVSQVGLLVCSGAECLLSVVRRRREGQ